MTAQRGHSEHRFSRNYRAHCDCPNCEAERHAAKNPAPPAPKGPAKLGLLVIAPDDTVRGAIVRRDGEDWHYEDKP
jgi:hypothetical protein